MRSGASVTCSAAAQPIAPVTVINLTGKVKIAGKAILTTADKVQGSFGTCQYKPNPSGTPPYLPCSVMTPQGWQNTDQHTIASKKSLTKASYCQCAFGGKITFKNSNQEKVTCDNPLQTLGFTTISALVAANHNQQQKTALKGGVTAQADSIEKLGGPEKAVNQNIDSQKITEPAEKEPQGVTENSLCNGCAEYTTCRYIQAEVSVDNDSGKLRRNMEKIDSHQSERLYIEGSGDDETDFIAAAHHIIPGKQVFGLFPELVKLATAVGYDINNEQNGIYLMTKSEPIGGLAEEIKQELAYSAMGETGKQWHLGPHNYQMTGAELKEFAKTHDKKFENYVDEVFKLLERYQDLVKAKKTCPMTPDRQKEFTEKLDKISADVAEKLTAFEVDPQASFPYYVSKAAYRYAYPLKEEEAK